MCPGPGPAPALLCPGAASATSDSTIETGPAHWLQGWFDVRLSQPKLGWDADSVRKSSPDLQRSKLLACLPAPSLPLETGCSYGDEYGGLPMGVVLQAGTQISRWPQRPKTPVRLGPVTRWTPRPTGRDSDDICVHLGGWCPDQGQALSLLLHLLLLLVCGICSSGVLRDPVELVPPLPGHYWSVSTLSLSLSSPQRPCFVLEVAPRESPAEDAPPLFTADWRPQCPTCVMIAPEPARKDCAVDPCATSRKTCSSSQATSPIEDICFERFETVMAAASRSAYL